MDYYGKKIVIAGAGLTGQALALFFCARGAQVCLTDSREASALSGLEPLQRDNLHFELGGHKRESFVQADLIALSPGIPLSLEPVQAALAAGVPVLGEIEIAARELSAPLIAVTGTNGKSTTTSLIGEILRGAGHNCFVGGNLGTPLISACGHNWDSLVVELSSFQLETVESFSPKFALLLNLSEDHLDRYADFSAYVRAKEKIFCKMGAQQYAILNAEDPRSIALALPSALQKIWFSAARLRDEGMGRQGDQLVWRWQGTESFFPLARLQIQGEHNIENAMAALIPPLVMGISPQLAWQKICAFKGLPHRMQLVSNYGKLRWFDDSKGTNVASVVKSLAGLSAPVTLIAGGVDKGGDYAPLRELLRQKVVCLLLMGAAAELMEQKLGASCPTQRVADMAAAVALAARKTPVGGAVLLSPACSSFDMYPNYAARGDDFKAQIQRLEVPS
ncbi:MAG: UDP-N-acetylmuramoyl-L-alanine--D-glutamate ligase [Deltaproteobacteria bacterium]|nr:UDP-N-acetylmuramoyl-L-alanine--D-glutamate ligase [Deltaproteobacteria bacterium]NCP77758.1 UDP-N-acetylmuramoyl-L-alanine--D-glutamate ligase [Desulfuromonadales bacterium]